MLAIETRGWAFTVPPTDSCDVQCPRAECGAWSALTAWSVEEVDCDTCGEHDAMVCPVCAWEHDHVSAGQLPLRVRPGQLTPDYE